jgi:RNA-splicing ligase RtcB
MSVNFHRGCDLFDDYVEAADWAQDYTLFNRSMMMKLVLDALAPHLPPFKLDGEAINCHHNYVAVEHHFGEKLFITRKGATAGSGRSQPHESSPRGLLARDPLVDETFQH